jgi:hypothetical protein
LTLRIPWRQYPDEGRKRVLLIAAILAARKLDSYDPMKRVPATMSVIADVVRWE